MPAEYPSFIEVNLREPLLLLEVPLRAPFWAPGDLLKRHVYFVRHLALCDRAKRQLGHRGILRIGYHLVKESPHPLEGSPAVARAALHQERLKNLTGGPFLTRLAVNITINP